ncbi:MULTISPECIES: type VI secretion system tip protein TssI/VgrG [Enterobacter]|uniref:type VI secretion system tip protein TssI/VgrG n=1 Tax=Enterobacter TaxID=547 RepID=UPI000D1D20F2|nr:MULTISPECIES: type VI secretion system tip protein TssI/VgrG [Enterobacter]RAY64615.1 type VI secretion system tip protein VgrG [Enterobacter hormaechei]MBJ6386313.1 type VI secretion system tip protein VgrG [Enterobacter cloacae]MBJ6405024.1 type VI secretion system tip protein VgrG [Enterobacter cloacae]MBJ6435602.1 type VI secretion system tip protein VgrG [Enterobacter cloacae]MBJ6458811.1 type VI secretion system tip protein VgrG [Enterobacter cloacae]
MSSQGLRFTLDVEGLPPNMFPVVEFNLNESLSTLFRLDVSVSSEYFTSLSHEMVTEKTAILKIWEGETILRHVKGIVTAFSRGEFDGQRTDYWLEIRPPFWRSALRQNFRSFQNQDIETIITTLLEENGVTEYSPLLGDEHPPREFCVQYGETDYDFLLRLMAEEGIFFYEEYADDGENQWLILADNVSYLPGPLEIQYNPDKSSGTTTDHIDQFSHSFQVSPSSVVSQDYTFKRPGWRGQFKHVGENTDWQSDQYEIFDYPGRFKNEQHGMEFTRRQVEGLRNGAETALCNTGSPKLWPGMRFTMSEHPLDSLNRTWQVVNCYMHGEQPQAVPGSAGEGTTLTNQVHVMPADRTWHSAPLPKPRVDGPQSATVTGPEGEEIFCDEYGRVRVKFVWDRYNKANQDSSCWVRVSQAWAGTGFGNLAIPRVGQEVIVDFLNGDPDQPIIMGRTYREDNKPQGGLPGSKTQMSIRSKTYKGGGFNEIRFEDATSNEQVYIHAQKNMDTEVLNNRTTDVKMDHTETIGNNQSITVGVGQTVKVGGKKEGGHDQSVSVANDQKITVNNDQTVTVKNDQKLDVTNNRRKDVGNDQNSQVVGNDTEDVLKSQTITVGENFSLTVTNSSSIDSGDVIELKCGASLLRMDSAGRVTIKGTNFLFDATGPVQINGKDIDLN